MRLSATERIIREAEEAETKALDHTDDTKVSHIRSAEALQKLRSFDPPSPTAERERPRSRETFRRLPAPATSAPVRRPPAGLPQGRPKPAAETEQHPAEVLTVELPFPLSDIPEAPAPQVEPPEPKGVGRRLGFIIAAATATTVVLVCGAWMAHTGRLGRLHVSIVSPAPSPNVVVVPPTGGPLIHPIVDPAPAAVAPPPEPAQVVAPSPPAAEPPQENAAPQAAPAAIEPETHAAPAKRSRPAHKASGGKASKRKAHGAKVAKGSRSGRGRGTRSTATATSPTPAPTSPTRAPARKAAKLSDSPDDVLPMSSD